MHTLIGSMTLHVVDIEVNDHMWLMWRNSQDRGHYFSDHGAYHMEAPAAWQPVTVDV